MRIPRTTQGHGSVRRALGSLVLLSALTIVPQAAAEAPLEVWVSIQPQRFVVEALGGDAVSCQVLVGPGQSPATYEPTPQQLAGLSRSPRLIRIGVPFEHALAPRIQAAIPELEIVDGRRGIALYDAASQSQHTHSHDPHHGPDPHFWLDPQLMIQHVRTVADALCRWAPDRRELFEARAASLTAQLEGLDRELSRIFAPFAGRSFFVYHAAFGYLARRYGLIQVAVEESGKAPGPRRLAELIDEANEARITRVFVQSQFSDRSARNLASAVHAEVVSLDPLSPDYLVNLEHMAREISAGFASP